MRMTKEQLQELEEAAGLFFPLSQLETLMGYPEGSFTEAVEEQSEVGKAILRGRLAHDVKLRKSIQALAYAGSGPAQQQMLDYKREMDIMDS